MSYCRTCGMPSDSRSLDERRVCTGCAQRLASGATPPRLLFCASCGIGPWAPQFFDASGRCTNCQARPVDAPPPPPLRPRSPCARCGGGSFVRVLQVREQGITDGGDYAWPACKPLAITFAPKRGKHTLEPDLEHPIGSLEAYVCRGCGFTELYTRGFAELPIGDAFGTEAFDIEGSPYR